MAIVNAIDNDDVDAQLANLGTQLLVYDGYSEEYATMIRQYSILHEIKLKQDQLEAQRQASARQHELDSRKIDVNENLDDRKLKLDADKLKMEHARLTLEYQKSLMDAVVEEENRSRLLDFLLSDAAMAAYGNVLLGVALMHYEKFETLTGSALRLIGRLR